MLETNIRIVKPGARLYVLVRKAIVSGSDLSADLLERACNALRYKHNLAAVPEPGTNKSLLVASAKPISNIHLEDEEWELDVTDAGENSFRLEFSTPVGEKLIPRLIERTILANLKHSKVLWTLDSPRIFYESAPFIESNGVAAYRRYEISAMAIEKVGVGIVVDVGTAFFTLDSLAYFFDSEIDSNEKRRREEQFMRLTGRQDDQKGTLLYNTGQHRSKCYFEAAPAGVTCATTGKLRVKGQSYESLLDYYHTNNPGLPVNADTPAVRVSFPGIERPQSVAADRVFVRVMNDNVPDDLSEVDKISPQERRSLVNKFWYQIGTRPLGEVAPGVFPGFWRPGPEHLQNFSIPNILFGNSRTLQTPTDATPDAYRKHYRQRVKYLDDYGCYSVPPAMTRTLFVVYPTQLADAVCQQLAKDMIGQLNKWTGVIISAKLIPYENVAQAVSKIKSEEKGGVALFILNDEPTAYYDASFQLPNWRIKRITLGTLEEKYKLLQKGAWDRRSSTFNREKGKGKWEIFIDMNSLALLYLLETVPFRTNDLDSYDAQLVIDVGHNRNFFALGLLVDRAQEQSPSFLLRSDVHRKTDTQSETINPVILADQIQALFKDALPRNFQPLQSLLILRDGMLYNREAEGIHNAVYKLKEAGILAQNAVVDIVDLHKDSLKSIRLWEVDERDQASNSLEGWVVGLNSTTALLSTTGAASLHQGTAEPIVLKSNGHCSNLLSAAHSVFTSSQMNWFSPGVAQRLPLALKIADDELQARSAQEVRRLR